MKKIILICFTVFLNVFLFSCSSDDDFEKDNTESTEIFATDGEDGQTPAEEEDGD